MLAKDYRTRCTLDSIVNDDWVTNEGSEPLFDIVDFSDSTNFVDFLQFAAHEDATFNDSFHVLIMDSKLVNRTMLSQKISTLHHAVCACLGKEEEVLELMRSAMMYNPDHNFDYVFIQTTTENKGLEVIQELRKKGFKGKLIAVNYDQMDVDLLVNETSAHCQVKFPIPVRDVTKILSVDAFEEVHTLQRSDSLASGVSQEDVEKAITYQEAGIVPEANLNMPTTIGGEGEIEFLDRQSFEESVQNLRPSALTVDVSFNALPEC